MAELETISIIIVDFFKAGRVVDNVKGALSQKGAFELEVIVIDNSCDKDNRNKLQNLVELSDVTVIFNDANVGYVEACNQGFDLGSGEYIFLVNPDIVWKSNDIISDIISTFNEAKDIGVIGVRQENDDGSTPEIVRRFPNIVAQISRRTFLRRLPWFESRTAEYEVVDFDYSISTDVDWVQSSFMCVKRNVWLDVNGLDSRFFLFMADPDICYQTWLKGYRVFYQADILVGADGKRCSAGGLGEFFTNQAIRYHLRDAIHYQLKYLFKAKTRSKINLISDC
ncbi:MAG: glycosyl transferase family 2 [Cycloclasticus sp.]|nr:MAG: glycosyl transferase family 2 [Cycloclasticus sp.]